MAPHQILDAYYLTLTFLISFVLQASLFLISFTLQTDKLTDFGGSINFFILALVTLLAGGTFGDRNIIASVCVLVWSFRLGGFLFFRVLKTGKDGRFDEMRAHFFKFMGFWIFQLLWCFIVSLPLTILNSPAVSAPTPSYPRPDYKFGTGRDIAGLIMFILGFALEVVGDQQKYLWKSAKPAKGEINDKGVWRYTRHPNFAGEIFLWWGIWILCITPAVEGVVSTRGRNALYASVLSPIFITLLLFFVSGLPLAEKPTAERYYLLSKGAKPLAGGGEDPWEAYQAYLNRTSILIPFPPAIYVRIPTIIKRTVLLDLPMFQFSEEKDGKGALEKERKKLQGPEEA